MKKFILLPFLLLSINVIINAQTTSGTAPYNKVSQSAVLSEFPFIASTTEEAIKAKMKSLGYTSKSSKGFEIYKGVKLAELGIDTYDMYFSVEKKSKKEKDKSIVTLLLSKGYDNFINEGTEPELFANAKVFVNNLVTNAAAIDLEKQIAEQEDVLKKADKKYNNAVDDGASLEKKKRQIEQDIVDNIKDQASKKNETEAQKQILETLKAKRKG